MNTERAGRIILDELCNGNPAEAVKLMDATRTEAGSNLSERGSEQLAELRAWFEAQLDECEPVSADVVHDCEPGTGRCHC